VKSAQQRELLALAGLMRRFADEHYVREPAKHADLIRIARDLERVTEQSAAAPRWRTALSHS
jgi:hypothetical protein